MDLLNKDELPGSEMLKLTFTSNVWILWTIRTILVIYASFIAPNLNKGGSMFFNNMFVRLIFAVLIIYLCYVDPTSAILLAVSFVVSVQTLNKHKINNMNNTNGENYMTTPVDNTNTYESYNYSEEEDKNNLYNMNNSDLEKKIDEEFSNHTQAKPLLSMNDPLMTSLEKEVKESVPMSDNNSFTNSHQLLAVQENTIENSNQNDSVQTFKNQFSAQGSNYPSGYNLNSDCMNNSALF